MPISLKFDFMRKTFAMAGAGDMLSDFVDQIMFCFSKVALLVHVTVSHHYNSSPRHPGIMSATLDSAFLHVCWITIMHTMYK